MPTKFRFQSSEILIVIKIFKQEWCPEVESNHRHKDFQNIAPPKACLNKGFARVLNLVCDIVCEMI